MAMNNPYQQYQQNSIFTARPEELTLMLYDGCIKFINQSIYYCEKKDYAQTNTALIKSQNILQELNLTLKDGYAVTDSLRPLYDFMISQLMQSNLKKDTNLMKEVLDLVTDLRNTWKEAMKLMRK